MSYGIGIVILKDDLEKKQIRYDFCDWTLPIIVKLNKAESKRCFKNKWYKEFKNELKFTTLEKLKTAPCDCVCIIDSDGEFDTLKSRTPINDKGINIEDYLVI